MATCLWAVFYLFRGATKMVLWAIVAHFVCSFVCNCVYFCCVPQIGLVCTRLPPNLHHPPGQQTVGIARFFLYIRCCWCNLCRFFYKLPQNKNYRNFLHNPTQPTPIALIPVIPTVLALYNPTPTLHQPTPIRGLSCMLRGKQPSISTH